MNKMPSARKVHSVRLDKPLPEDTGEAMDPDRMFAAIEQTAPGSFDEEKVTHLVTMDYHPQVTLNTRLRTEDGRDLWVRGLQDVDLRHVELRLLCEEVLAR